jgi:polyisoprenoid-binding protein YceI
MTRIGQDTGTIEVFTFREGALSALGHDLRLRASRFDIDILADSVTARVDASSLRVATAMRGGAPMPGALSDRDKADIERNCAREVLEAQQHAEATFVSFEVKRTEERAPPATGGGRRPEHTVEGQWMVRGKLTIHGVSHEGSFEVRREGDKAVARIDVDLRSFGMKPYSAMLGALRVKPVVLVVVEVPVPPEG